MGASFRIDAQGGEQLEATMAGLVKTFGDLTPLMRHLGGVLETQTADRFDSETDPDGKPWKPSQRVREHGGKTLTLSGLLRASIVSRAGSASVEVGTNKVYAGVHQFGFDGKVTVPAHQRTVDQAFGRRLKAPVTYTVNSFERTMKMPRRAFLGLGGESAAELLEETEDFLAQHMGPAS